MKKIFLALAALATMAAVSCVKDEQYPGATEPEPEPEIVYDYSGLVLNELCGLGEDNEKFIELFNNGSEDVDLAGVTINKDEELAWTGKKGQVIKAGEVFAIVGAKGTTEDGFSTGFSAKKTVIVELFDPAGKKLDTFQRGEKGEGWGDGLDPVEGSWSRIPDGTGKFLVAEATPGALNSTTGTEDPTLVGNGEIVLPEAPLTVVLNELYGDGEDEEKFFELYNPSDKEVSLAGYTINKDEELCWTGADDLKIAAKGFYLILGAKGTTEDGFSSGFSSKKTVIVELFDANGNKLDTFQRGDRNNTEGEEAWGGGLDPWAGSWSRIPDGTGDFMMTESVTGGAANNGEGAVADPDVK